MAGWGGNLVAQRAHDRKLRARNNAIYDEARSKPCVDCGIQYPLPAMHLDHVRGVKVKPVSQMDRISVVRLKEEIAKCDVRCANCHAIKTHRRSRHAQPKDVA